MLRSAFDGGEIEMIDMANLIWSESNLLSAIRRDVNYVKGRRNLSSILCSPVKGCAKLRADLFDRRQG